jgi:hypothetical protein
MAPLPFLFEDQHPVPAPHPPVSSSEEREDLRDEGSRILQADGSCCACPAVHILIPENQGQRPDIETEGIQGSLTIQHTGYTYQKYTLRFPESRDEQQHTDAIRLLAHPIAKWATFRIVP